MTPAIRPIQRPPPARPWSDITEIRPMNGSISAKRTDRISPSAQAAGQLGHAGDYHVRPGGRQEFVLARPICITHAAHARFASAFHIDRRVAHEDAFGGPRT